MEEARIAYELEYIGDFKTVANYAKEKGISVDAVKKQEDDWIIPVVKRKVIAEAVAKSLGVSKDSEEFKNKQAAATYSEDEYENLLYAALDKIINKIKYVAQ